MELKEGMIVRSLAGRDKGTLCCVLAVEGKYGYLADGRRRKCQNPKRKSGKHLMPVGTLPAGTPWPITNQQLRRILLRFAAEAESARMDKEE